LLSASDESLVENRNNSNNKRISCANNLEQLDVVSSTYGEGVGKSHLIFINIFTARVFILIRVFESNNF